MDDSQFDSNIREKLGDYEAPGFDPAALASLHHQMAAISITPWYSTYRTELIVGNTILMSTLLIIWSQWLFSNKATEAKEIEMMALKSQSQQFGQLQQELEYLKSVKPDTVHVIEYQQQSSILYLPLLQKIDRLERELKSILDESTRKNEMLLTQFKEQNELLSLTPNESSILYNSLSNRITPRKKPEKTKRAIANELPISLESSERNLSSKTIKEIQKHYQKGIGIKVGPSLLLSYGSFDPGDSRYNFGGGVLADFIVSPSLSIEAGVLHTQRHNRISSSDLLPLPTFPGADESLGKLNNVDIDSWVFETPINLKYRYPVSLKSNWIFGAGYSAMLYSKQILEYDYLFDNNPSASLNSSILDKQLRIYPGTVNLSLGFSSELKNKKIFEASLYYRYGIGKVGIEQTTPEFIGISSAYWFTLK
ncbi:MAG TPA: hypothetical protein DIW27_08190 [Cytophagales bacterium]|nr:hypothetical protein [Cytophagales bacterium]